VGTVCPGRYSLLLEEQSASWDDSLLLEKRLFQEEQSASRGTVFYWRSSLTLDDESAHSLLLEEESQSAHEGTVCFCRNSVLRKGRGEREKERARERRGQTTCMVAEW
jgi:hypothetical protein